MGNRFESATILELSLHLLQRHDLSGHSGRNGKHLPQQGGTPHSAEGKNIATDRWLDDGVAQVGAPARKVRLKLDSAWIRTEADEVVGGFLRRDVKSIYKRSSGPVAQDQSLETTSQAFPRPRRDTQGRGAGSNNMYGNVTASRAVPVTLEPGCPVREVMNFIQEQNRWSSCGARFRFRPLTLPKSGKCRVGIISGCIHSAITQLRVDVEKQGCLAHLPWAGEKLNARRRGLLQSGQQ